MKSEQTLYAINLKDKISRYTKYLIHIPTNIEHEPVFGRIIQKLNKLPKPGDKFIFRIENDTCISKIKDVINTRNKHSVLFEKESLVYPKNENGTINVFFLLKKLSVSYNPGNNAYIQKLIANDTISDYIIIVPGSE